MRKNLLAGSLIALFTILTACDSAAPTASLPNEPISLAKGGNGGGNGGGDGYVITLLSPAPGAPAVSTDAVSFYAVQGEDREAEVHYLDPSGGLGIQRLLRLRVRPRTQIVRPNGTLLAPGDSILITMQVIDPVGLVTKFEPAGLGFTGKDPAKLTMWYLETDHDLNHDGVVNAADLAIQRTFSIFRQAAIGAPWTRIPSMVATGTDQVEADIPGFSNYVIAY